MTYESLDPISRREVERLLSSSDAESVATALLRSALHDPDWHWVQEQGMRLAGHPSPTVRRAVAMSFGHLARLHGEIEAARVLPVLHQLARDAAVAGAVSDALDDIATFTGTRAATA